MARKFVIISYKIVFEDVFDKGQVVFLFLEYVTLMA